MLTLLGRRLSGAARSARIDQSRSSVSKGKETDKSDGCRREESVTESAVQALSKGRALLMRDQGRRDDAGEDVDDAGEDLTCRTTGAKRGARRGKQQLQKSKRRGAASEYSQEGDMAWLEGKVRRLQEELEAFLAEGGGESAGVGALRDLQIALASVVGITESGIRNLAGHGLSSPRAQTAAGRNVGSAFWHRRRRQEDFDNENVQTWSEGDWRIEEKADQQILGEEEGGKGDVRRSQIVAAVDGLRDFAEIDSMTPWFRQASFGVHVSVMGRTSAPGCGQPQQSSSLQPSHTALWSSLPSESNKAQLEPAKEGVGIGVRWSPPGSPGNELTSTEMVAAMMQGRWAQVRAELVRQESGLVAQRNMVLQSGQQLVTELANVMETIVHAVDDARQAERIMLEDGAHRKELEMQCGLLREEVSVQVPF